MEKGWYVYMLHCADGTLYTGSTNDPRKRLAAHNAGTAAKYTRSRLPVQMAYLESAPDKSAALRREAAVKMLSRENKQKLLSSDCNLISQLLL